MNSTEACIALNMLPTMGPVRLRKLLEVFRSPERILAAGGNELRQVEGVGAEVAGEYLKKGRPVFIEGRLQLDTWDDKQSGQKRSKLKVIGETMQLLGGRGGAPGGGEEGEHAKTGAKPATPPRAATQAEPDDDEIPF